MPRTYGTYRFVANGHRARWEIELPPDRMMRLKRILPRARQAVTGTLMVAATREVARDIDWFIGRYPMSPADQASLEQLLRDSADHEAGEEEVLRILGGHDTYAGGGLTKLGITPREYQLVVPAMVSATGRLLCADGIGLGKTLSGSLIFGHPGALPALIVAPSHLAIQWQQKLLEYYPGLLTHIVAQGTPYDPAEHRSCGGYRPDALIVTYSKLGGWADHLAGEIKTVIFDEAHELRNGVVPGRPVTRKYAAAIRVAHAATYRVLLTATPVFNYGDEMHSVIYVMDPDALGTREEFLREHGSVGTQKLVADPRALGLYLRESGLMVRRTRADVGRQLPPVSRIEQPVETDTNKLAVMTDDLAEMARVVLDRHAAPQARFSAAGQLDMRLRHATGLAKAPFVAEFVKLLLQQERKVLLAGWHRDVYEVWLERLAQFRPVLYTGTETLRQKDGNAREFIHGDSRVMIMSLRSGAGLDGLESVCSTVVFGELDWSPAQHDQVIGRFDREGQPDPVIAFFCVSDAGADPPMAEVLDLKRQQAEPLVDPNADLVQPSSQAALERVKALAEAVLRREASRGGTGGRPHVQTLFDVAPDTSGLLVTTR